MTGLIGNRVKITGCRATVSVAQGFCQLISTVLFSRMGRMAKMTQARRPAILGLTMLSRKKLGQTVILCLLFGIFYLSGHSCFFIESISEVLQRAFKYFIHLKVLKMQTHNLGYPRIGSRRELKKACESFWAGKISEEQLHIQAMTIRHTNWKIQQDAGVSLIPSNNFFITN